MADPFSIIGVLAVAIDGIQRASKFVGSISGAPDAVTKLNNELKAISQLLNQINSFINDIHAADSSAKESFIPHLQMALDNCKDVASEVEALLRPYVKPTGDPRRSAWRRLAWILKDQKTVGLEKDMTTCKQTLNMAISFAELAVSSQSNRRVMKIERGMKKIQMNLGIDNVSVVDSDYAGSVDTAYRRNIMTSQWIMQSEIVEEETTEDHQEIEYHKPSQLDDIPFGALDIETPIKSEILPPPKQNTVNSTKEKSSWSTTWTQFFPTTKSQAPVTQQKSGSSSKIFQWKPAQKPPQPTAPQKSYESGQLIRKTIVSREGLQAHKIKFTEEGNYVRLPEKIDAYTLDILRAESEAICTNRNLWWTNSTSKPAVTKNSQSTSPWNVVLAPPNRPTSPSSKPLPSKGAVMPPQKSQNDRNQQIQTLRKTIVSRSALQKLGISYSEDVSYVLISPPLESETVQRLRTLSTGNSREWWT